MLFYLHFYIHSLLTSPFFIFTLNNTLFCLKYHFKYNPKFKLIYNVWLYFLFLFYIDIVFLMFLNQDIYKVNSDTYRIDDTIRATSQTSDRITNNDESSLLSVRTEKENYNNNNNNDNNSDQESQRTINNKSIMSNNHIFNDKEEEESDLVFENLIKSSSSSIKVNREKSFIVDSFNKTTEKSLQQTPRNNKNSDSIEMHLTNNNNNINTDFNNKSLNTQVTINNNNNNSNKENFNNSNEMNYSNNSNKPQYSIAVQPNINKPIAAQVTISNSNNLKNDSNSQLSEYSIAAQPNNLNDFNKNKPIVAQHDINFNPNQQLNNNINFESNDKPIMHNNNYNQQNHTNHNVLIRPQYSNSSQSSIEFNNKPIVSDQIINSNEQQFDSTFTKRRQQPNDEMNSINNLKINLNEFDDKNYKNNNMVNSDYYEKASQSPPPPSNQSSKATEDFLNEIRMSNQSFQTPLSSNRKKIFSNPGSAHKPPHTLPPLNASKKYMSINNNNVDTEINNNNYESIFNGIEVYSNTPSNVSHQNQSRTSINHSNLSIGYNPNQINDQIFPENFSKTNNNNLNQEFDALQSRRRLLHELSVYI
jgi:hypothetical protein